MKWLNYSHSDYREHGLARHKGLFYFFLTAGWWAVQNYRTLIVNKNNKFVYDPEYVVENAKTEFALVTQE